MRDFSFDSWASTSEAVLLLSLHGSVLGNVIVIVSASLLLKIRRSHTIMAFLCLSLMNLLFSLVSGFEFYFDDAGCESVAWIIQYTLIAQELYSLMFALDLWRAVRNPFSTGTIRLAIYHVCVFAISLTLALVLEFSVRISYSPAGSL